MAIINADNGKLRKQIEEVRSVQERKEQPEIVHPEVPEVKKDHRHIPG